MNEWTPCPICGAARIVLRDSGPGAPVLGCSRRDAGCPTHAEWWTFGGAVGRAASPAPRTEDG